MDKTSGNIISITILKAPFLYLNTDLLICAMLLAWHSVSNTLKLCAQFQRSVLLFSIALWYFI